MTWNPIWGQAMCPPLVVLPIRAKRTVQLAVTSSQSGDKVRLRFSNIYGKRPYVLGECTVKAGGVRALVTLEGRTRLVIPCGGLTYSDTVPLHVTRGSLVEVSMYFLNRPAEGNAIEAAYVVKGRNVTHGEESLLLERSEFQQRNHTYPFIPALDAIEVESPTEPEVIVAFGDSITQQGEWTRPLAAKLLAVYQDGAVLINKGISGNRILQSGKGLGKIFGDAAKDRLERDVLSVPGVTTVIIALGTNDIGMSTRRGKDSVTSGQLTGALQAMADRLKERGIRSIGTTLLPRMGSPRYKPYHEGIRNEVNAWIRTCCRFDQVVDFDEATRADDDPIRMKLAFDSGDHLHPSSAGGQAMAEALAAANLL